MISVETGLPSVQNSPKNSQMKPILSSHFNMLGQPSFSIKFKRLQDPDTTPLLPLLTPISKQSSISPISERTKPARKVVPLLKRPYQEEQIAPLELETPSNHDVIKESEAEDSPLKPTQSIQRLQTRNDKISQEIMTGKMLALDQWETGSHSSEHYHNSFNHSTKSPSHLKQGSSPFS